MKVALSIGVLPCGINQYLAFLLIPIETGQTVRVAVIQLIEDWKIRKY